MINLFSIVCLVLGSGFYLAGTIGLLRFPDTFTRLHALTKADNLGLGFIVLALAVQQETGLAAAKLATIWLLALLGGSSACHLLGQHALATRRRATGPASKP